MREAVNWISTRAERRVGPGVASHQNCHLFVGKEDHLHKGKLCSSIKTPSNPEAAHPISSNRTKHFSPKGAWCKGEAHFHVYALLRTSFTKYTPTLAKRVLSLITLIPIWAEAICSFTFHNCKLVWLGYNYCHYCYNICSILADWPPHQQLSRPVISLFLLYFTSEK